MMQDDPKKKAPAPPASDVSTMTDEEYNARVRASMGEGAPDTPQAPHPVQGFWDRIKAPRDDSAVKPAAGIQMQQTGITPDQRAGYTPGLSDGLYKYVTPSNYMEADGAKARVVQDVKHAIGLTEAPAPARQTLPDPQEDSWRLYLGLPEHSREFGVSPYTPSSAKGDGAAYFRIHDFIPRYVTHMADRTKTPPEVVIRELVDDAKRAGGKVPMSDNNFSLDNKHPNGAYGVMQNFQVSHGHDEVGPYLAYYDKWDLHTPGAEHVGKPYDLYDRTYYDPKTFKIIPEAEVLAKKAGLSLKEAK